MVPKFWNSFYGAPLMAAFGVGCWAPRVGGACSFRVCGSAGGAFGGLGLGVFGIVGLLLGVGLWCFRWVGHRVVGVGVGGLSWCWGFCDLRRITNAFKIFPKFFPFSQ